MVSCKRKINHVIANALLIDYYLAGIISIFWSYTATYHRRDVF